MADTKRVIIGSETDDTKKIELVTQGVVETVPVSIVNNEGTAVNPMSSLIDFQFDAIYQTLNALSDVYVYKLAGVTQATITVNYPDITKDNWTSIIKT